MGSDSLQSLYERLSNDLIIGVKAKEPKVGYALLKYLRDMVNSDKGNYLYFQYDIAQDNESIFKNPSYKQLINILTQKSYYMEMFTNKNPTVILREWNRALNKLVRKKLTTNLLSIDLWDLNRVIIEKESDAFDADLYKKYYYKNSVDIQEI